MKNRMISRSFFQPALVVLTIIAGCSMGCGPQNAGQAKAVAESVASIWETPTASQVANMTVAEIYDDSITLTDGEYEGAPLVAGAAMRPRVHLISELMPTGDLNGDGIEEVIALLEENSGGTGHFLHLVPFAVVDGQLTQLGHTLVGDRVKIRSVMIEGGRVVLRTVQAGPGDGACCPTEKRRRAWALQEGQLTEVSNEAEGTLSLADFAASEWVLTDFNIGQPVPSAAEVTLQLDLQQNQVFGSSGCNRYFSSVESPAPRKLVIGPVAGTKRMCQPELMDVEAQFLKALGSADSFTFHLGDLAIGYSDGDHFRTLLFAENEGALDDAEESDTTVKTQ